MEVHPYMKLSDTYEPQRGQQTTKVIPLASEGEPSSLEVPVEVPAMEYEDEGHPSEDQLQPGWICRVVFVTDPGHPSAKTSK